MEYTRKYALWEKFPFSARFFYLIGREELLGIGGESIIVSTDN